MKRLLTTALYLLAAASTFSVQADPCDNLRNNQQAYRDCVNDWYGRSNKGGSPTPWWKNYDPNAGSGSAPAEAPTLSKQQQIDLQLQRERQQREAEREAAEERRKQLEAETNIDAARKRANLLTQRGIDALSAGRADDALRAFYEALNALKGHESWRINFRYYPQLYEGLGRASAQLKQFGDAEIWFKKGVDEFAHETEDDIKTGAYGRAYKALADFYETQGRLDDALKILLTRFNKTQWLAYSHHPETIAAAKDYVRVKEKRDAGPLFAQKFGHMNAMNEPLYREDYAQALKASDDALAWATEKNDAGLSMLAQRNKAKALLKLNRGGEAHDLLKAQLATLDKTPPPLNRNEGFGEKQSMLYEVLGDLAEEHESTSGWGYAEPYRRRMLEIQEKTRGPEHLETLAALRALANNLSVFGKYTAAVPVRQRAVAVAEKLPAAQSQLPALRQALLSDYRLAGGFEQEANALEAQIDWKEAWLRLSKDAGKAFKARQYEQAIEKGQIALDFVQQQGASDSRLATSQNNLAVYYRAAKQYEQAEALYIKALTSYANSDGADSPSLILPLQELASLYELQKRFPEAEPLYKRLLPLQEKKHGAEHANVAATLTKLAKLHRRKDQYREAEPLYTRALAIVEKQSKPNDELLMDILPGLAEVYRNTQRADQAEQIDKRYEKLL